MDGGDNEAEQEAFIGTHQKQMVLQRQQIGRADPNWDHSPATHEVNTEKRTKVVLKSVSVSGLMEPSQTPPSNKCIPWNAGQQPTDSQSIVRIRQNQDILR